MFSPFVCVLLGATEGNAHAKLAHEPRDVEGSESEEVNQLKS